MKTKLGTNGKKLMGLLLAICLLLSMTASLADGATEKVKLKYVFGDMSNANWMQEVIDAYEAQNPNVEIEVIEVPGDGNVYEEKLAVMLAGGDDVDALWIRSLEQYAGLVQRKQLEPLNAWVEAAGLDMAPYAGGDEGIKIDGELYALPYRSDFWLLFYNKDVFDAAGIDYPSATEAMTWTEYRELAKQLTRGEGNDKVYGAHTQTWLNAVAYWGNVEGCTMISGNYDALKPYYELFLAMQNEDKSTMDYASLKIAGLKYDAVFYKGEVGMVPMGTWFINMLINKKATGETDVNWGIAPAPHSESVPAGATFGGVTTVGVNAKSEKKEIAFDFIRFLAQAEGAAILAKDGMIPAYMTPETMETIASAEGFPAECKDALNVTSVAAEFPAHVKGAEISQILNEEHELIMLGEESIDDGIANMNSRVQQVLAAE